MYILKIVFLLTINLFNITYASLPAGDFLYEQFPLSYEQNVFGDAVYTFNQRSPFLRYYSPKKNVCDIELNNFSNLKLYQQNRPLDIQTFYIRAVLKNEGGADLALNIVGDSHRRERLTPGEYVVIDNPTQYSFYEKLLQQIGSGVFYNSASFLNDSTAINLYNLSKQLIALWAQNNNLLFWDNNKPVVVPLKTQISMPVNFQNQPPIELSPQQQSRMMDPTVNLSIEAPKLYKTDIKVPQNGKYFEIINAYRSKLKFPDQYEITLKVDDRKIDDLNATYNWDEKQKPGKIEVMITPPQNWKPTATGDVLTGGEKIFLTIINQGNTVKLVKSQIRAQVDGLTNEKNYAIDITHNGIKLKDDDSLPLTGPLDKYGIVLTKQAHTALSLHESNKYILIKDQHNLTTPMFGMLKSGEDNSNGMTKIWIKEEGKDQYGCQRGTEISVPNSGTFKGFYDAYRIKKNLSPNDKVKLVYAGNSLDPKVRYTANDIAPSQDLSYDIHAVVTLPAAPVNQSELGIESSSTQAKSVVGKKAEESVPTSQLTSPRNLNLWQRWTSGKIWSDWLQQKKTKFMVYSALLHSVADLLLYGYGTKRIEAGSQPQ